VSLLGDDGEDVAGVQEQVLLAVVLDLGAAVLGVDDDVTLGVVQRDAVAVVVDAAGFSLAVSGMTSPEAVVCSASSGWTRMRSSSGLIVTATSKPFRLKCGPAALSVRCSGLGVVAVPPWLAHS
jgi:hypothetical protein